MRESEYYQHKDIAGFMFRKGAETLHIIKRPDGLTHVGITYFGNEKLGEEDEEMSVYLEDEDMKVLYEFIGKCYGK